MVLSITHTHTHTHTPKHLSTTARCSVPHAPKSAWAPTLPRALTCRTAPSAPSLCLPPLPLVRPPPRSPFSDTALIDVSAAMRLRLRIPCWSDAALVSTTTLGTPETAETNGTTATTTTTVVTDTCAFHGLSVPSASRINVTFINRIRVHTWAKNGSGFDGGKEIKGGGIEVHRGALLFALRPKSVVIQRVIQGSTDPRIKSREVTLAPNATWNYALLPASLTFIGGGAVPSPPFDTDAVPAVKITARARRVPGWTSGPGARGVAALPASPLHMLVGTRRDD